MSRREFNFKENILLNKKKREKKCELLAVAQCKLFLDSILASDRLGRTQKERKKQKTQFDILMMRGLYVSSRVSYKLN